MLLTEEEAVEKWCPQGLATIKEPHCVASKCMAWRWDEGAIWKKVRAQSRWKGYCGLAVKPEGG